jgi:hypothetical protein
MRRTSPATPPISAWISTVSSASTCFRSRPERTRSPNARARASSRARKLHGLSGHARFAASHEVQVDDAILGTERIFINVGGRAIVPKLAWPRSGRLSDEQLDDSGRFCAAPSGRGRRQLCRAGIRADLCVGVVLLDLVPASQRQLDLFEAANQRRQKLPPLIDRINYRYGRCAIGFGLFPPDVRAFKGHAAFHRVPERWEF